MGQLEIQDGFTPYFDRNREIEVVGAESNPAPRRHRSHNAETRSEQPSHFPSRREASGPNAAG